MKAGRGWGIWWRAWLQRFRFGRSFRTERDCVRRTGRSGWGEATDEPAREDARPTEFHAGRAQAPAAGLCHSRAPGNSGGGPPQSKTRRSTPTELRHSAQRWRDEGAATLGERTECKQL